MENLLELENISMIPSKINNGWELNGPINYLIEDRYDKSDSKVSLPIITSPMESIIDKNNWTVWRDNYIKPILPRTEDLKDRLEACCYIFSAFSINEVKSEFLDKNRKNSQNQYHICIDAGNGHDIKLLEIGSILKNLYEKQVILMGGNIDNPQTYIEYSRAGFDYVRVGMSSGSTVDKDKFGFHYPMASLLIDIKNIAKTAGIGLKPVKIIADGGITCCSDILKAIALGADYVMVGREFAKILESAGTIYHKGKNQQGKITIDEVNINNILINNSSELTKLNLVRMYRGNTTLEMQALRIGITDVEKWKISGNHKINDSTSLWVNIDKTLKDWLDEFKECTKFAFMMSYSSNWIEFKENIRYITL